jgi:hypothetical protein
MTKPANDERRLGSLNGVPGFFFVVDPRVLNPTDVRWLLWGDSAQHYLGDGLDELIVCVDHVRLVAISL